MLRFLTIWSALITLTGCGSEEPPAPAPDAEGAEQAGEEAAAEDPVDALIATLQPLACDDGAAPGINKEEDGILQYCDKKGKLHGNVARYDLEGVILMKGAFEDDKEVGLWTWTHPNGNRMRQGSFKVGKKEGNWSSWYEDGAKEYEGAYLLGREIGKWTYYYESGNRKQEGYFQNGAKNGEWLTYADEPVSQTIAKEVWRLGELEKTIKR